jgi:hypothetical protein
MKPKDYVDLRDQDVPQADTDAALDAAVPPPIDADAARGPGPLLDDMLEAPEEAEEEDMVPPPPLPENAGPPEADLAPGDTEPPEGTPSAGSASSPLEMHGLPREIWLQETWNQWKNLSAEAASSPDPEKDEDPQSQGSPSEPSVAIPPPSPEDDEEMQQEIGRASSWIPEGEGGSVRWKRRKVAEDQSVAFCDGAVSAPPEPPHPGHLVLAATLAEQKALDREVPYGKIPPEHLGGYHRAEEKEWKSWLDAECVQIVGPQEAAKIKETIDKRRLIRLRFVYRDKNTGLRTEQTPLPV